MILGLPRKRNQNSTNNNFTNPRCTTQDLCHKLGHKWSDNQRFWIFKILSSLLHPGIFSGTHRIQEKLEFTLRILYGLSICLFSKFWGYLLETLSIATHSHCKQTIALTKPRQKLAQMPMDKFYLKTSQFGKLWKHLYKVHLAFQHHKKAGGSMWPRNCGDQIWNSHPRSDGRNFHFQGTGGKGGSSFPYIESKTAGPVKSRIVFLRAYVIETLCSSATSVLRTPDLGCCSATVSDTESETWQQWETWQHLSLVSFFFHQRRRLCPSKREYRKQFERTIISLHDNTEIKQRRWWSSW